MMPILKNPTIVNEDELTMSSVEIAYLTGKKHKNVMRDIRNMFTALQIGGLKSEPTYFNQQNKEGKCYCLSKELTLTLVSGYSIQMRHLIIKRWLELEQVQPIVLPDFNNPVVAARAWATSVEASLKLNGVNNKLKCEIKQLKIDNNMLEKQFSAGLTAPGFCRQLNGVNLNRVSGWLMDKNLFYQFKRGYKVKRSGQNGRFKEEIIPCSDGEFSHKVVLTEKGAKWLYGQYLNNKLPMKKDWDGKFTHDLFQEVE
ncbi:conserved hypothetical protein [Psychromonas ingrahamii 37]|uniref:Uncharacterized protein n=1 Tax=Psychromonas ingrahamii (strain DSM 17664 / CCUG 51855 / 37) TaxID=357804 RepID=A1SXJ5_PSYIN|nr:Rha family transcriptional regulator [Psychromonas ingrahamii]ABM04210.1 conserved hypothetical protein [Psychromonas ingrahamii 37]